MTFFVLFIIELFILYGIVAPVFIRYIGSFSLGLGLVAMFFVTAGFLNGSMLGGNSWRTFIAAWFMSVLIALSLFLLIFWFNPLSALGIVDFSTPGLFRGLGAVSVVFYSVAIAILVSPVGIALGLYFKNRSVRDKKPSP